MIEYTALAPLTVGGRELRSGEAFTAPAAEGDALVDAGLARRDPSTAAPESQPEPQSKKRK